MDWDASWRACDAWAWYVGVRGVGCDVLKVLVMLGRGAWNTWRWLGCAWRLAVGLRPSRRSKEHKTTTFYYNTGV